MLSIGKIASGQGRYYLDLAREDYYFSGGEPLGNWHGNGAKALGLKGTVMRADLERLFTGFGPDGATLVQNAGKKTHRPGFDLTFSAPKSVSVLWSQTADSKTRRAIQDAHAAAVAAALAYIEDAAGFSRRGKEGKEVVRASMIFATFEHGTSRALDPQLHTHALAINAAIGADGRFGTLEGHAVYEHKMAAGALYRTELAHQLLTELGLELRQGETSFEIEGVPEPLNELFSKRRDQIEKELKSHGLESATAAAFANLATREVKDVVPPRQELFEAWRKIGSSHLRDEQVRFLFTRRPPLKEAHNLSQAVHDAANRLTETESHFAEKDLLREVANHTQSLGISADRVRKVVSTQLAQSRDLIHLAEKDGHVRYTTRSFFELEASMIAAADRLNEDRSHSVSRKTVERIITKPRTIESGGSTKQITLSAEQAQAVRELTGEGRGRIRVLEGLAGTTKTTTLFAVRQAWEKAGYSVLGAALAAKAAKQLQNGAGIEDSMTIAKLELKLFRPAKQREKLTAAEVLTHEAKQLGRAVLGKPRLRQFEPVEVWRERTFKDVVAHETTQFARAMFGQKRIEQGKYVRARQHDAPNFLTDKTVLIIDEASMVGTAQLSRIIAAVEKQGGIVVLVGDRLQLQAIEAGGAFAYLADRHGHAKLTTITRQRDERDRSNVTSLADGKAQAALDDLAKRGLLTIKENRQAAIDALVTQWTTSEAKAPEGSLIFCGTNKEAEDINLRCQKARLAGGVLKAQERMPFKDGELFRGDRVLFTETSRSVGVNNGETGTIVSLNGKTHSISVLLDDGDRRTIPLREYKHVRLGYAVTTHKGQGTTVENAYVLAGGFMQDKEISYVQMSRARGETRVFSDKAEAGARLETLARQMSKSRTKDLAHELAPRQRRRLRSL